MNTITAEFSPELPGRTLTVGGIAEQSIAKYVHKIGKFETEVLEDRDPEMLHKMRVTMRRLRSILKVLEPAIVLPRACSRRVIGHIAAVLGAVRDLDVMQATLQIDNFPALPDREQQLLTAVSASLAQRRRKAFNKMKICLLGEYREFEIAAQMWLHQPTYRNLSIASQLIGAVLPDLLLPPLALFFLHEGWTVELEEIDECQLLLHDLRKSTKRIRYQTEYFLPLLQADVTIFLPLLETAQELLGQVQDALVLREILTATIGKKALKQMPVMDSQITQKKLQAWQEWQLVRKQLCSPDWRRSLRLACL